MIQLLYILNILSLSWNTHHISLNIQVRIYIFPQRVPLHLSNIADMRFLRLSVGIQWEFGSSH